MIYSDLMHNMDTTKTGGGKPRKYDTYIEALSYLKENSSAPAPDGIKICCSA